MLIYLDNKGNDEDELGCGTQMALCSSELFS